MENSRAWTGSQVPASGRWGRRHGQGGGVEVSVTQISHCAEDGLTEEVKRVKQDAILDKPEAQGGLWWIGRTVGHGD